MKKLLLIGIALSFSALSFAQKTTVIKTESYSDTQARMLDVTAKSYVRPLVVDLVVEKGQARKVYSKSYNRTEVEIGMSGSPDNLRSRVVYDAANDWGCDAVVAATFKIELDQKNDAYIVEMKGFPANFDAQSWHPMDTKDYEWIKVDRAYGDDLNRTGAVIRDVRK